MYVEPQRNASMLPSNGNARRTEVWDFLSSQEETLHIFFEKYSAPPHSPAGPFFEPPAYCPRFPNQTPDPSPYPSPTPGGPFPNHPIKPALKYVIISHGISWHPPIAYIPRSPSFPPAAAYLLTCGTGILHSSFSLLSHRSCHRTGVATQIGTSIDHMHFRRPLAFEQKLKNSENSGSRVGRGKIAALFLFPPHSIIDAIHNCLCISVCQFVLYDSSNDYRGRTRIPHSSRP